MITYHSIYFLHVKSLLLLVASVIRLFDGLHTFSHGWTRPADGVCHVKVSQEFLRHINWIFR